jgi:hypothetical protein
MARPDPFLNMLKDVGFLPVRLPRADVAPLLAISRDGKELRLLGELKNAMKPDGAPLPPVVRDVETSQTVEGTQTSAIRASIGLELLGGVLKAFTGQNLNLTAAYSSAKTVRFQFGGVTVDKVDVILLDQYLHASDISDGSRYIERLMIDDKVGVITSTLRAKRVAVVAQDAGGTDISVSVPAIHGVIGGTGGVEIKTEGNTKIAYEGDTPVTIGVQAIRLFFDEKGDYTAFDPFKVGQGAVRSLGVAGAASPLDVAGVFVDLVDAPAGERISAAATSK